MKIGFWPYLLPGGFLSYIPPILTEYWDTVSDHWLKSRPDRLWRRHSDAVNTRLLTRWFPDQSTGVFLKTDIFDEITGDGILPNSDVRGWALAGIDISEKILQTARRRGSQLALAATDVRQLPFREATVDVIFSNSTLDHFATKQEIKASIVELCRVLKPGGHLILTIDNPINPVLILRDIIPDSILNRFKIVPYFTGQTLSPGDLRRLFSGLRCEILTCSSVLHCPRFLAVNLARFLDWIAPRRFRARYLELLMRFELLESLPTRYLTGYFTSICCRKIG
ncbi:MAG: class I SAM-dependent methyltransferase [Desulfobacterales bacterium]|nr:class I SAM-dependent methyltransferase [Desulfobacterales bacterium]